MKLRELIQSRLIVLAVAAFTALGMSGAGTIALGAEPIVLKVTSQFRTGDSWDAVPGFVRQKVQENMSDKITIRYLGGPEVISGFEQAAALKEGTIDLLVCTTSWSSALWPMIEAYDLTGDLKPWDEEPAGLTAFLERGFAKQVNAKYLGRVGGGIPVVFYTLFKPASVEDFNGRLLRVTPLHREAAKALGAKGVTIAPSDMYAALDRGTIEGLGYPTMGLQHQGVTKIVKYRVEPGFYHQKWAVLVNMDTWNKMPADTQNELAALMKEIQRESHDLEWTLVNADTEVEKSHGIEIVTLADAEAMRYRKLTIDGKWDVLAVKYPDEAKELGAILKR
jgi:TRAP-type C4-dicarboxylate transport system substrate-binding protein